VHNNSLFSIFFNIFQLGNAARENCGETLKRERIKNLRKRKQYHKTIKYFPTAWIYQKSREAEQHACGDKYKCSWKQ